MKLTLNKTQVRRQKELSSPRGRGKKIQKHSIRALNLCFIHSQLNEICHL